MQYFFVLNLNVLHMGVLVRGIHPCTGLSPLCSCCLTGSLIHPSLSSVPSQQLQPSLDEAGLSSLSLIWSGKSYVSICDSCEGEQQHGSDHFQCTCGCSIGISRHWLGNFTIGISNILGTYSSKFFSGLIIVIL